MRAQSPRAHMIVTTAVALTMVAGAAWAQTGSPPAANPTGPTAPTAQTAPAAGNVPPEKLGATVTTAGPGPAATTGTTSNPAVNLSSQTTPGAPVPGANSFTEAEAKSRIEGHGFSQVSGLKLDGKGIWRGMASKDGHNVSVALDYQGNVVAE